MQKYIQFIANRLGAKEWQVENTIRLLNDGATIPFISRYRKEATGSLDEEQIAKVRDELQRLKDIDQRREAILKSIREQEKLTPELEKSIQQATSLTELEDLYLPYKPKRKTRASVAREKGLEPLARELKSQNPGSVEALAEKYLSEEVETHDEALQGARDILAEWVNEDSQSRQRLRILFDREAVIYSRLVKGKEEEGAKFSDYFDWQELLRKCPSHRLLAMKRGEDEGFLKLKIYPPEEEALEVLSKLYLRSRTESGEQVEMALEDAWKRLLQPSLETESRNKYKELADEEAIRVFRENLRQLLMASPLGQKRVLALDPGFRTGCKVVCLDAQGNLLHNETIYPHPPKNETAISARKITNMVNAYKIEAIAIGNGTASRETESFIQWLKLDQQLDVFMVDEAGASIYSASKTGREEFPDYDVTVRGAVSIGRRLMDPLAELVKIDPKSIGVGQYQHDVDQQKLKGSLDETVESCVNAVGVELNTASKHLLNYVSGLGPQLAENIVNYRKENGAFSSRKELMKVKRMGAKAFEQSAGFLRIREGKNPLDNTAVHPESYPIVEKMAASVGSSLEELISQKEKQKDLNLKSFVTDTVGMPTLKDILKELEKPGRDPRDKIQVFRFDDSVHHVEDLKEGMVLPGIVTNITNFGAFVDVGVHQDGLVHISQLANRFVKDPNEVVKLRQHVKVKVMRVDLARKRIQLTMKDV